MAKKLVPVSLPRICQHKDISKLNKFFGHFYIVADTDIPTEKLYLHNDGVWRETTKTGKDNYTGYYHTRDGAEKIVRSIV